MVFKPLTIDEQFLMPSPDGLTSWRFGRLAEAMLFYPSVELVGKQGLLKALLEWAGPDPLMAAIADGQLSFTYSENFSGLHTTGGRHEPVIASAEGIDFEDIAIRAFRDATGKSGRGSRLAKRFLNTASTYRHSEEHLQVVRGDFKRPDYVSDSARSLLKQLVPAYRLPDPFRFEIEEVEGAFIAHTNVDFHLANQIYRARGIPATHSTLEKEFLLAHFVGANELLHLGASRENELAIDEVGSVLVDTKLTDLLRRSTDSTAEVRTFEQLTLEGAGVIRTAIDSGARDFEDLRRLLDNASQFKEWLAKSDAVETSLAQRYQEAVSGSWVEALADKVPRGKWRFAIFQTIGTTLGVAIGAVADPSVGVAASAGAQTALAAADTFLLDKLRSGWKPDLFVEEDLKPFVHGQDSDPASGPDV